LPVTIGEISIYTIPFPILPILEGEHLVDKTDFLNPDYALEIVMKLSNAIKTRVSG
jgi:hypothetical protein